MTASRLRAFYTNSYNFSSSLLFSTASASIAQSGLTVAFSYNESNSVQLSLLWLRPTRLTCGARLLLKCVDTETVINSVWWCWWVCVLITGWPEATVCAINHRRRRLADLHKTVWAYMDLHKLARKICIELEWWGMRTTLWTRIRSDIADDLQTM